jgi:hypothetical protein
MTEHTDNPTAQNAKRSLKVCLIEDVLGGLKRLNSNRDVSIAGILPMLAHSIFITSLEQSFSLLAKRLDEHGEQC